MMSPDDPDFWTEQLCPEAPDAERHHWVPRRDGNWSGVPSYRDTCRFCGAVHDRNGAVIPAILRNPARR